MQIPALRIRIRNTAWTALQLVLHSSINFLLPKPYTGTDNLFTTEIVYDRYVI